jgi:flagellar assembly protein FliH
MEDIAPERGVAVVSPREDELERSALAIAEAEVRKLKSELRICQSELSDSSAECRSLRESMQSERAELERERRDFLAAAERDAAECKEAARMAGHEEGYAKGYGEGLAKAEADVRGEYEDKFQEVLSLMDGVVASLQDQRARLALSHAPQLIRLWETMLRRMLQTMVDLDPEAIGRIVESLLKRISDRERIVIYLNPEDVAVIEGCKDELMDSIRGVKLFELMSDDHVDKGSCLIETNLGIYDARWRTQLEQVSSEVQTLLMESIASDDRGSDG